MCNCQQRIEERTKFENDATSAFMEHGGNKSEIAFTPLTVSGKLSMHRRYTFVNWKFCPFCGQKK